MSTHNIVLTDEQASFIAALVGSGRYQNSSEALRDGVRLLQDVTARREAEIEAIRSGLIEGVLEANEGTFASGSGKEAINRAFARAKERTAE